MIPIRQIIRCDLAYQIATVIKGTVIIRKVYDIKIASKEKKQFRVEQKIHEFLSNSSRVLGFFFCT